VIALYCLAWGIKGLQLVFIGSTQWVEPLFQGLSLLAAVSLSARSGIVKIPKRKSKDSAAIAPIADAPSPAVQPQS
jgi:ribose transport system permease protein